MRIASVADVKARFSAYLKASEEGPIIVTRNGKPVAVLLSMTDEDELEWRLQMTAMEILQSVQFVTVKGKRLAILSVDDWEALIEWLETLEDAQIARQALAELKAAGRDRQRAGWLEWEIVEEELA
ncbi:MAG: type II toxin-antitoxin system Phd/YefM family antitoxin [Anaerolineae bacterium]